MPVGLADHACTVFRGENGEDNVLVAGGRAERDVPSKIFEDNLDVFLLSIKYLLKLPFYEGV
jgi:hypothetical protein